MVKESLDDSCTSTAVVRNGSGLRKLHKKADYWGLTCTETTNGLLGTRKKRRGGGVGGTIGYQ